MIEGIPVIGLTAPSLVGLAVVMLLMGRIVPRATLLDKSKEAADWKAAYESEREARATSDAQTAELLEVSKTTHAISVAMFDVIRHNVQPTGGTDVAQK